MESEWFLVPAEQTEYGIRPKYADLVQGFSGQTTDVTDWGAPLSGQVYMVRFFGTSDDLLEVKKKSDAFALSEFGLSRGQVEDFLHLVTGNAYSLEDWNERLKIE